MVIESKKKLTTADRLIMNAQKLQSMQQNNNNSRKIAPYVKDEHMTQVAL